MSIQEVEKKGANNSGQSQESILASLLPLFALGSRLSVIKRQGWKERGIEDGESVANHSYLVASMTMFVAEIRGLDVQRATKMAIIHDWPEAEIGDVTPYSEIPEEKRRASLQHWTVPSEEALKLKRAQERDALIKITQEWPEESRSELLALWEEYAEGTTAEAKLVRQMDRIQRLLQARHYRELMGKSFPMDAFIEEGLQSDDPEIQALARDIRKALRKTLKTDKL